MCLSCARHGGAERAAFSSPFHKKEKGMRLTSVPSFTRGGQEDALHSRAYHLVRFPDPHPTLAPGEVPPPLRGAGAFALPLHLRRELIPPVALSDAEKKAGLDVRGKRPNESMAEYNSRRQRTPKHRDEFRWVLESHSGDARYEGKEVAEHSGAYLAVFPPDQPGGALQAVKVDLWVDMKRFVDLTDAKARVSDAARVKKLQVSKKRNMQSAMGNVMGAAAAAAAGEEDGGEYDDPDLKVDHVYDLAVDRAGLDKDAMADNDYEYDDDDQGAGEVAVNDEGLADVLPGDGEVLDSADEADDDDDDNERGGGGAGVDSSDGDAEEEQQRPTMLATVALEQPAAKRRRMDPLTELVVRLIRTSGGRIQTPELLRRLKAEGRSDHELHGVVKDVILRVGRRIANDIDGEMIALRDEFQ